MIAAASPTAAQNNAITSLFAADVQRFGWWHWMPDFWIIVDSLDRETAETIRNAIGALVPELHFYVFPIAPLPGWAGNSPFEWAEWLHVNWPPGLQKTR